MAKDNPLHQALLGLPLWVKIVLCLVDVIYGADRIVEAAVRKSWMALLVAIVWLFVYPVNLIVDLILIMIRGRWFSIADLMPPDDNGGKKDAIDAQFTEKDPN